MPFHKKCATLSYYGCVRYPPIMFIGPYSIAVVKTGSSQLSLLYANVDKEACLDACYGCNECVLRMQWMLKGYLSHLLRRTAKFGALIHSVGRWQRDRCLQISSIVGIRMVFIILWQKCQ